MMHWFYHLLNAFRIWKCQVGKTLVAMIKPAWPIRPLEIRGKPMAHLRRKLSAYSKMEKPP